MGVVDGAGGDEQPVLNMESTYRNHELDAGAPPESHSINGLNNNKQQSRLPYQQKEQNGLSHSELERGKESTLQKASVGGGSILRSHRDQRKMQQEQQQHDERQDKGGSVEKDGVQGRPAVEQYNGSVGNEGNEEVEAKVFKRDTRDLEELLSKLNPMAEEFVPPVLANHYRSGGVGGDGGVYSNNLGLYHPVSLENGNVNRNTNGTRRRKNSYSHGKRMNNRTSMAQREEIIRRTVYVSDIDHQVTEEHLAALFINCGQVVDCRICGDPNSVLRFAFIEFTDEEGARAALGLAGTMLGYYPVRVLPSKTAIAPVNPTFLPRSEDEREMCARTIYCTNIDKRVSQADVRLFFESVCGEVHRLRLLGDYNHATRIAFVEFVSAQSAIAALNCSGVVLGSLPIRISPSKTPVRPRAPRPPMH